MSKTKELQELGQWNVGMEVSVHGNNSISIAKISRITDGRSGTVYIERKNALQTGTYETAFDIHGHERGGDTWHKQHIVPLTESMREKIVMDNRQHKLINFKFSTITPSQASEIVLFMREKGIKI